MDWSGRRESAMVSAWVFPCGLGVDYCNVGQTDARYLVGFNRNGNEWTQQVIWQLPGEEKPLSRDNVGLEERGQTEIVATRLKPLAATDGVREHFTPDFAQYARPTDSCRKSTFWRS